MSRSIDSYSATPNASWVLGGGDRLGGNFTGNGVPLTTATVSLGRVSSSTGTVVMKIYAATGTLNTTAVPTGSALATSNSIDVAIGLSTSTAVKTFTFSGSSIIIPAAATRYFYAVEYTGSGQIFGSFNTTVTSSYDLVSFTGSTWTNQSASGALPFTVSGTDLMNTLTDNFDDNSINSSLWSTYITGGATVAETGGRLVVTPPLNNTSSPHDYGGLTSINYYDLALSTFQVDVQSAINSLNGAGASLSMWDTTLTYSLFIEVIGSQIAFDIVTPSGNTTNTIAYNQTQHRFWRVRHAPSTLYLETSPTGETWTTQLSLAATANAILMFVRIAGGSNDTLTSPTSAIFDNVNVNTATRTIASSASGGGTNSFVSETATTSIADAASGGGLARTISVFQPIAEKEYEYRVFTHAGAYLSSWSDVISDFGYDQSINQAPSEITVKLSRSPDNRRVGYEALEDENGSNILDNNSDTILLQTATANAVGPDTDVLENLNVDVYAFYGGYESLQDENGNDILDENSDQIFSQFGAPNGKRVYSGYIADYDLTYGSQTGVSVTIVQHATEMSHHIFTDSSGHTTVSYNSVDPVTMARDAMAKYQAEGGVVQYSTISMPLSGETFSYDFKLQKTREVQDKVIDFLPSGYYHFVDPGENIAYLLQKSTTAKHTFYYEKHIQQLELKKSITQLVNKVYFVGGEDPLTGDTVYTYDEDATSIANLRPGLDIQNDGRVTDTDSAHALALQEIDSYNDARYTSSVTISDTVYDIESIKLGETVGFKNFATFADSLVLQIVTIHRAKHSVTLDLDMIIPSDTKRVYELKKQLQSQAIANIATAPST